MTLFKVSVRAVVLALSVVTAGLVCAPVSAQPLYPTQDSDPFYSPPADLGSLAPGDVVRTRRIDTGLYVGTEGWQVAFRSTNSAGQPILGMTTVLLPAGVSNPPLVSYQALINSLGAQCNPSRSLFNGELQDGVGAMLPIGRGWAISLPDYLGPNVAYGAAKLSGMVTLDSVKAVRKATELGLTKSPVALAGYSGGGMATAWAAALQPKYAPDLKLDAVVAGGIPADLEQMALALGFDPHPGFGLAFAAAMGLEREYPDRLPISDQLNENGLWFREFTHDACRRFLLFHGAFRSADQMAASKSLMDSPEARAVLHENSLRDFDGIPTVPTYFWQGRYDTLTAFAPVAEVADRYCKSGVPLVFRPYDIAEHMTAAVAGFADAWSYVESRFRGDPARSNC
ncbi:lipase family protein [Nocardia sp. CDC160]|uniref:lipase family protein n=1 Tax=Nocardia sp. CDC160 TaxID=3112166 RepID=UPI002DBBD24F|nr:lipase family protein [Nocardia sp. CDC160]MEC3919036.1 lipase family protein [Nocardia sp. CDC160]